MDLLVRLQFAAARDNKSPIRQSTARQLANGDVLGMRPLTMNKGCTGDRWVVESWTVFGIIRLTTDETARARWWNTSTMARADTCPLVQLQPSCCMISTKQLAKSGIPGWLALEARAWKLGVLC